MDWFVKKSVCGLFVASLFLSAGHACAQIAMSVRMENSQVLQFESLHAYITLVNDSDEAFIVNKDDPGNTSSFEFRIERGLEIVRLLDPDNPVVENLRLAPDDKREIMVDVSRHYDMSKMGTYLISAVARSQQHETISRKIMVDVVRGMELTSLQRSATGYYKGERSYTLLRWNRNGVDNLFFRVDGVDDGFNYGVFPLGKLLRVIRPTVSVDRNGVITVFHQPSPSRFVATKFRSTYDAVIFVDQSSKTEDDIAVEAGAGGTDPDAGSRKK